MTALLVKLILENLIFRLMLVQQPGHFLVFPEQLIILPENKFNLILELGKLFALCLEKGVLFLKHGDVSFE